MLIAAAMAVLASVGYGASNVVSAMAVRRLTAAALALWAQLVGLSILAVAMIAFRPEVTPGSAAWGVAGGIVAACGVLLFYTALQRGSSAVVGPVAGCGVIIPVVAGILGGASVGWRPGFGAVIAVVGVVVVASVSDDAVGGARVADEPARHGGRAAATKGRAIRRPGPTLPASPGRCQPVPVRDGCVPANGPPVRWSAVPVAGASAVCLGFFFVMVGRATAAGAADSEHMESVDTALVVASAVQIGSLAVTLLAVTRHTRACVQPGVAVLAPALVVGLFDVSGDLLLAAAVGRGPLAVVGPLGSLAPVVAVLFALLVRRQRLGRRQLLGIALILVGIGFIVAR